MSRDTVTVSYPAVTLPALRRVAGITARLLLVVCAGGLGTVGVLYVTGLAPQLTAHGLTPLVVVPVGIWLGSLSRSLTWLLVGLGVGLRLGWMVVGTGPFVTTVVRARRVIVIRMIPVNLCPVLLATQRPALKLQYWLTALWALIAMAGAALATWTMLPAPWGPAVTAGIAISMLVALWPYRHGSAADLWILFRLPFLGEKEIRQFITDPDVLELEVAEEACQLERAKAALGRLEAGSADRLGGTGLDAGRRLSHWRCTVLEMEGRYADAVREQRRELDLYGGQRSRPWRLLNLAGLLLAAGDAGQLPVFEWQPAAEATLAEIAGELPYRRLAATRAYYHVLTGDYRRAARLARTGIRAAGSRVEAAQSWCTLAVARAGTWDAEGAAEALAKARALAPGLPRLAHAEERVALLMPVPV